MTSPAHMSCRLRHLARGVVVWAGFSLGLSMPVQAQTQGVMDHPRTFDIFNAQRGYKFTDPERNGTLGDPHISELGAVLMVTMFRTICLGLEDGQPLAALTPEGFSTYDGAPYDLGPGIPANGRSLVLSLTGDAVEDEDAGKPSVWLTPSESGMTCRLNWPLKAEPDANRMAAMADVLMKWLPYTLSAVQETDPFRGGSVLPTVFAEWDRPCGDRWCPVMVLGSLKRGQEVSLSTTLNIISVEGARP